MVTNENPKITEVIQDKTHVRPSLAVNQLVNNSIQPVISADPEPNRYIIKSGASAGAGSTTLYTTPTDEDFFLTGMTIIADVSGNGPNLGYLATTVNGEAVSLLYAYSRMIDGTDEAGVSVNSSAFSLAHPVKLDRNVTIDITNAMGNGTVSGSIFGFTRKSK